MNLSARGQLFVAIVSVAGLLVLGGCIASVLSEPVRPEWLILAVLTLLSGSFTIKIPTLGARFSVSETFVFTSVLLFGTSAGTITLALDALIAALGSSNRRQPLRIVFNLAAATLSIWIASRIFFVVSGIPPLADNPSVKLPDFLWPLVLQTLAYFLINSVLVAVAIAYERNVSWFTIWRRSFLWLGASYFTGASVAALLVSYTRTVDFLALGIIVPLLLISYLTFKTSLGRIEDATRHVEQVNTLYLSTIETLAMAIDAKDQVTHGHIRRVQRFALGLADELGVRDEHQIKALEAAALLHDTGKLVVPEHILNKPGRLTTGEFEKMKLHASAGAEILSAINFPYPVVPIVRHHHENWDGTGYPDGLRGTDIPIGARILAVVDCFDALTSDRPYRQRLSDSDAMQILVQRRAKMYDPLVVDTFVAVKDKLSQSLIESEPRLQDVIGNSRLHVDIKHGADIFAEVTANAPVQQLLHLLLKSVIAGTPARLAVLFGIDSRQDELHALAARSRDGVVRLEAAMPVGSRVSGWVAANGSPIANADASLDLPSEAARFGLLRCLCVPIRHSADVLGVVSLYLDDPRGFSERDLVVVEAALNAIDLRPLVELLAGISKRGATTTKHPPTVH